MSFRLLLDEIRKNLLTILQEQQIPDLSFTLEPAKEGFGDVTCNIAFLASKTLKKRPNEIAQLIASQYEKFIGELVSKVESHPSGYVNFYADNGKLAKIVIVQSQSDDFGSIDIGNGTKITVEHKIGRAHV